jgi:hypothetical protein
MIRSPTYVCAILSIVTLRPVTVAPAGIVLTAIVCDVPAGLLSGMFTAIVPDDTGTLTGGGDAENCVLNKTGVPAQIAGDAGVMTGVGGFGFTLTDVE